MRYFLEIAYLGKNYFGWQRQPNDISVQEVLEECLSTFLRREISIIGAGRTDTGVHAKKMMAHFDTELIADLDHFKHRMNSFLPYDIVIHNIFPVQEEAHARFDALERTYHYKMVVGKDPFQYQLAYQIHQKPDVEKMNQAAEILLNYTDFQCFSKSRTDVKTYNCKIVSAFWTEEKNVFIFSITADRFLRNMVRAIVGTLLDIGFGKKSTTDLLSILESKNRSKAGASAPAEGLYLMDVRYPEEIFLNNLDQNQVIKTEIKKK